MSWYWRRIFKAEGFLGNSTLDIIADEFQSRLGLASTCTCSLLTLKIRGPLNHCECETMFDDEMQSWQYSLATLKVSQFFTSSPCRRTSIPMLWQLRLRSKCRHIWSSAHSDLQLPWSLRLDESHREYLYLSAMPRLLECSRCCPLPWQTSRPPRRCLLQRDHLLWIAVKTYNHIKDVSTDTYWQWYARIRDTC